jgi:hypothetical protein
MTTEDISEINEQIKSLYKKKHRLQLRADKQQAEKLIGTCWIFRNSYGGDFKSWDLYTRIDSYKNGRLNCISIQIDEYGQAKFELIDYNVGYLEDNHTKIPKRKFDLAAKKFIKYVCKKLESEK